MPSNSMREINGQGRLSLERREVRPFYIVLILTMAALSVWILISESSLQTPIRLAGLASMLLIHLALHWGSTYLMQRPRWIYPYLILQCLIILTIAVIASGSVIVLAFFLALAGEALGYIQDMRRSVPAVTGILLLSLITFVFFNGWSNMLSWLALIVPMGLFSFFYITMFGLQAQSRAEAQRLLHELETAHHQLAEYATQLEDLTLTAERERIARELHDTLAQGLAGLILQLEAADSYLSRSDTEKAKQIIQHAMSRARATLAGARQAISNLRAGPPSPSELENAVRSETERFTHATGIACEVDIRLPAALTSPLAENALRAVSEGLANVARHAEASRVWLSLQTSGESLEIKLRDDGVGFDQAEVDARSGHYGLIGLRERARLSGGSIDVQSAPGEGTILAMLLPLIPESED